MNLHPQHNPEGFIAALAAVGAFIGIGKVLSSTEPLTFRLVAGRALTSAGLGACAGGITLVFPSADPMVTYGAAALLASLGTSFLEAFVNKTMNKNG